MKDYDIHQLILKAEARAKERGLAVHWDNSNWVITKQGHVQARGETARELMCWLSGYDVGRKEVP